MYKTFPSFLVFLFLTVFLSNIYAGIENQKTIAVNQTKLLIEQLVTKSYPEIKLKKIRVKTFESDTNFFKARFSISRYLTFQKMRHIVYVNPKVFTKNAPKEGIRSIVAHELAHVLYYTEKNRLELLGLASLASGSFTTKFERKADLETIKRGFGNGLIKYRGWLYKTISQDEVLSKKKNYFSPEEIELILKITKDKPEMFEVWRKDIPKNIYEIKKSIE